MNANDIIAKINALPARSVWDRGVKQYAIEAVQAADCNEINSIEQVLNGARDAVQYSEGGCALVYDSDIAARLCSPSMLRKKDGGRLPPNSEESWLDVQTRAVYHAFRTINRILKLG